ncbi:hypothetical protein E3N88_15549 [Mikania micrantha]|uniref:Integrase catalytic domain-containing protein n=1 Tax=Mikania micrantha TaxID=192012 RepID=A0A5N6NVX4_9ASTR|nr:hypothetical protein E3N88_15549 [Mikania micrantha]
MNISSPVCHNHSLPSSPVKSVPNSTGFTIPTKSINRILGKKTFVCDNLLKSRSSVRYNSIIVGSYDRKENDGIVESSPAKKLRKLLDSPGVHQGPACFDALSAKLIERAGFRFCFTTGFGISAARLSLPDTGLISYGEMVDQGQLITQAVSIPVIASGFIQPSTSPFSSPILLVKKKDATWRMCVDYRALNKITVADKYPIPNIDELLDEFPSLEQHIANLIVALELLEKNQFYAKLSKCCFGGTWLSWPNWVLSPVCQALCHYGLIARPLTTLTKKDGFKWTQEATLAFNRLKQALITAPVLRLPDFSAPFVVECDASSEGVGAILIQEDRPLAYFSKALSFNNRLKSAYDRELLALVLAVQKWNHYLMGRHFLIKTDHYTLKFLLEQRVTTIEQQRLLLKLMPYDFSIIHRSGKENKGVDALSRRPVTAHLCTLTLPQSLTLTAIIQGLQYTQEIIQQLSANPSSASPFSMVDQLLLYKGRIVMPATQDIRATILREAHDTPMGGHGGFLKTYKRVLLQFFWPNLKQDVRKFVQECLVCQQQNYETLAAAGLLQPLPIPNRECLVCQQQNYETLAAAGLLQPLPIPNRVWEDISLDFIVGLPVSNRVDTVLVVVYRLSKYAHFLPLRHPFTTKTVVAIFCKEIVRLHGYPRSIISNRDTIFLSTFWQELFCLGHTSLEMSTSYHPQTDGQTEVVNRCLEAYLRCFTHEQPLKWSSFLSWAEYSYNTGFHTSIRTTPFNVVYGRDPSTLHPYVSGETNNADLESQEVSFQVGDAVFLRIQPYRQRSLATKRFEKLSPRFYGPYLITKKIGPVAYELALPADSRIHPIFHVSMLKPARGTVPTTPAAPLPITNDWEVDVQPASILSHRWRLVHNHQLLELLVSWADRPLEEATWEDYDLFAEQFLHFRLEDKSFYREGSIDSIPPLKVYTRRKKPADHSINTLELLDLIHGSGFDPFNTLREAVPVCVALLIYEQRSLVANKCSNGKVSPKGCGHIQGRKVLSREETLIKIKAAVDARKESGSDIVIVSRTDSRQASSIEEALWRTRAFADAGADVIFIDALASKEEMKAFCEVSPQVPKMANMLEGGGKTPILTPLELEEIGYKIVAYPLSLLGVSIPAMEICFICIAIKIQLRGRMPSPASMPSFEEVKEVLGFNAYYEEEKRYATKSNQPVWQTGLNSYSIQRKGQDDTEQTGQSSTEPIVELLNPDTYSQYGGGIWTRTLRVKIIGGDGFEKLDVRIPVCHFFLKRDAQLYDEHVKGLTQV